MGITKQGIEGEQKLFRYLRDKGVDFFQADAIGISKDEYAIYEVKNKSEPFSPPPFWGHGLDIKQVRKRLKFQDMTGMRCRFVVFETKTSTVLSGWLDELNVGEYFDTKNGIRIYPLGSFDKEVLAD